MCCFGGQRGVKNPRSFSPAPRKIDVVYTRFRGVERLVGRQRRFVALSVITVTKIDLKRAALFSSFDPLIVIIQSHVMNFFTRRLIETRLLFIFNKLILELILKR